MLNRESIDQAEYLLSAARFKGIKLFPKNGTPLASIVGTLINFTETGTHEDLYQQSVVAGSSTGTHEELEDLAVRVIAPRMGNIINAAKNVVLPHCNAIHLRIEDTRKRNALANVGVISNIKQVEIPKLFDDKIFLDLIANYDGLDVREVKGTSELLHRILAVITPEDYDSIIKIGIPKVDDKIEDYLGSVPDTILNLRESLDARDMPLETCVWYLLFFAGVQNVRSDKLADLMEVPEYTATIANIISNMGAKIHTYLKVLDGLVSSGSILLNTNILGNSAKDVIQVLGSNYKKWLADNNGSPEALIGYYMAHNGSPMYNELLKTEPDTYRNKYHSRLDQAKALSILDDIGLVRKETGYYLADVISKMDEGDKPRLQQQLERALEHEYHGANNLSQYLIKVVTRTLYANGNGNMASTHVANRDASSDIKDLLIEMDSILVDQPDKDTIYAENLASIRLIARWLARSVVKADASTVGNNTLLG